MAEGDKEILKIIDNWDILLEEEVPRLTSIHYHVLFEPNVAVDHQEFVTKGAIDSVFVMNYNGYKEEHKDRQYNSLRILINDEDEGTFEGILLVISNNKRIPDPANEILKVMKQILK
jgi:hypothetical protein